MEVLALESPTIKEFPVPEFDSFDPITDTYD